MAGFRKTGLLAANAFFTTGCGAMKYFFEKDFGLIQSRRKGTNQAVFTVVHTKSHSCPLMPVKSALPWSDTLARSGWRLDPDNSPGYFIAILERGGKNPMKSGAQTGSNAWLKRHGTQVWKPALPRWNTAVSAEELLRAYSA